MEGDDTLPFVSVNVQILDGFKGYDLFLSRATASKFQ